MYSQLHAVDDLPAGASYDGEAAPDAAPRRTHRCGGRIYPPVKATVEWLVALGLLVVATPVLVTLALLVKCSSPGPAFYRQRRVGRDGRIYNLIKLRSMTHNCEQASGVIWSKPGDARVTRVGRWLRDTHLDELPQLLNILGGTMSLIGPRPERPELMPDLERCYPQYRQRLQVKPGLTGLAQMRLPADTELSGVRLKLAHDLYYCEHLSLLLDLRVMLATGMYFLSEVTRIWCLATLQSHANAVETMLRLPAPIVVHDTKLAPVAAEAMPDPKLVDRPAHSSKPMNASSTSRMREAVGSGAN